MSSTADGSEGRVRVEVLQTAEQLLDALAPTVGRGPRRNEWVFRGQPSSEMPLRPRAMRDITVQHAGKDELVAEIVWWAVPGQFGRTVDAIPSGELADLEFGLVADFATLADAAGMHVPGLEALRWQGEDLATFPPQRTLDAFALAQHAGIPTRLLDWTLSGLHAAYFACLGAAEAASRGEPQAGCFSVWAMKLDTFREVTRIKCCALPAAFNIYMRAQLGLASLVISDGPPPGSPPGFPSRLPDVDALLRAEAGAPLLVRYDVPCSEARTLLWLLDQRFVSADRLFPSLDGIARAIRQSRWMQHDTLVGERS